MAKLLICRGLPASGKSTFARNWVAEDPDGRVRVNRDDLRVTAFGKPHGVDERLITEFQHSMIRAALRAGLDVISDDTNLNSKFLKSLLEIAAEFGAEIEWHDEFLFVPLATCLVRDRRREARVGDDVIQNFYSRYIAGKKHFRRPELAADEVYKAEPYLANPELPEAILVDLDGTIAHNDGHRGFFDWKKVGNDKPHNEIIRIVQWAWQAGIETIFVSGREDVCFEETYDWILRHVFFPIANRTPAMINMQHVQPMLFMRKAGDGRKDSIVKLEIFDREFRNNYNVLFCLDDRNSVVQAYRSIGLRVLQVQDGDF